MSKIINLRRARKKKARDAKEKDAANNRAKHGETKQARNLSDAQSERIARDLDAHKLEDN